MNELNFSIEELLPETWREHVIPVEGKRRYKFPSREEGRNIVYGTATEHGSMQSLIDADIAGNEPGISFLRLNSSDDILAPVSPDIDTALGIYQNIALTSRFSQADPDHYRDAHGREGRIGIVYSHQRSSIEVLEGILEKVGLILSDPSYLFSACRLHAVQKSISERFYQLGVHEVAIGSRCGEESAKHHQHDKKGHSMPIMQLLYSPSRVIELDLTYPKPNGAGYEAGQSLWVVQKKK